MWALNKEINDLKALRQRIDSDPDGVLNTIIDHMITLAMAVELELDKLSAGAPAEVPIPDKLRR